MCLRSRKKQFALKVEITQELRKLEHLAQQLAALPNGGCESYRLELAAVQLQNFYKRCERILCVLTWELRGVRAHGVNWPQRLLREATQQIEGIRPAVVSALTEEELRKLLGFRNLMKNIYGYAPHPQVIAALVRAMIALYPRLREEITQYHAKLTQPCSGAQRRI